MLGAREARRAPVQGLAVMRCEQGVANRLARRLAQQIAHQDYVAKRLGHLLALDVEKTVVQPEAGERRAVVRADALGDLVFVVREFEIEAAAVDVDRGPEMRLDHRRALDVPARPAAPPGAVPAGLPGARRLPQHEIRRIALVWRDLHPGALDHLLARAPRQRAVRGETKARGTARGPPPHRRDRPRSGAGSSRSSAGTCPVAYGSTVGGSTFSAAMSSW